MVTFRASKEELTRAFSVVSQATDKSPMTPIDGQALVKLSGDQVKVYSTNKEMLASTTLTVSVDNEKHDSEFTLDPRKLLNLVTNSDIELITFKYDEEKKTLQVFASDDPDSYISFPSIDPELFLSFDAELSKTVEVKKVDAQIFLFGIRFILGFLSEDSKNKKYQNSYIENGVIYGSDGNSRLGAFVSNEFNDIDYFILRKSMIPQIAAMIEATDPANVVLKSTSRIILISTEDGVYNFGFTRAAKEFEPPKFSINLNGETCGGVNVDKEMCLKRLKRLAITSDGAMGVDFTADQGKLVMRVIAERDSVETLPVKTLQEGIVKFISEYKAFRNILGLFKSSNVDIHLHTKGNRFQIKSQGELVVTEGTPGKPFTSIAIVSQSRRKNS
jgi:hypothetical protein